MSYDIRTEHDQTLDGELVIRVQYRRAGSRGRFHRFVLFEGVPEGQTIEDVVAMFEKTRRLPGALR